MDSYYYLNFVVSTVVMRGNVGSTTQGIQVTDALWICANFSVFINTY